MFSQNINKSGKAPIVVLIMLFLIVAAATIYFVIQPDFLLSMGQKLNKRINDISSLRSSLIQKNRDIVELIRKFKREIQEHETAVVDEKQIKNIKSYAEAANNSRITTSLRLISKKKAYVENLSETSIRIEDGVVELDYLEKDAKADLDVVATLGDEEAKRIMSDIHLTVEKYLPEAGKPILEELDEADLESTENIWNDIVKRKEEEEKARKKKKKRPRQETSETEEETSELHEKEVAKEEKPAVKKERAVVAKATTKKEIPEITPKKPGLKKVEKPVEPRKPKIDAVYTRRVNLHTNKTDVLRSNLFSHQQTLNKLLKDYSFQMSLTDGVFQNFVKQFGYKSMIDVKGTERKEIDMIKFDWWYSRNKKEIDKIINQLWMNYFKEDRFREVIRQAVLLVNSVVSFTKHFRDLNLKSISEGDFTEHIQKAEQIIEECTRTKWNVSIQSYPPQPKDFLKKILETAKHTSVEYFAKDERIQFEKFLRQNGIHDKSVAKW